MELDFCVVDGPFFHFDYVVYIINLHQCWRDIWMKWNRFTDDIEASCPTTEITFFSAASVSSAMSLEKLQNFRKFFLYEGEKKNFQFNFQLVSSTLFQLFSFFLTSAWNVMKVLVRFSWSYLIQYQLILISCVREIRTVRRGKKAFSSNFFNQRPEQERGKTIRIDFLRIQSPDRGDRIELSFHFHLIFLSFLRDPGIESATKAATSESWENLLFLSLIDFFFFSRLFIAFWVHIDVTGIHEIN